MLETICLKCRQRYPLGQDHVCPRKSTAARKDVRALDVSVPRSREATATLSGSIPDAAKANDVVSQAGTQAPPVDTPTPKRVDKRKGDRHRAGYWASYQRKDRVK